jgi:lysophospholipase L1-like esterase
MTRFAPTARMRAVLRRVAVAACTTAIMVGATELVLRQATHRKVRAEMAQFRKDRPDIQFDQYSRIYSDERWTPYKYGHKPGVRVTLSRGYYDFTMVTNSEGLREQREYGALDRSAVFLGDSIVEGAAVENAETMDTVFEELTGVVALNFGVASRGTLLEYRHLKAKYRPEYSARLVILGYCLNDFAEATHVRSFDEEFGNWFLLHYVDRDYDGEQGALHAATVLPFAGPVVRWGVDLARQSETGRRLALMARGQDSRPPSPAEMWSASAVTAEERTLTEDHLLLLKRFTTSIGALLAVAIFPVRDQVGKARPPAGRIQDVLIGILERNAIPYLDLQPLFDEEARAQPGVKLFHDELHFTKAGHRLAGRHLAERFGPIAVP